MNKEQKIAIIGLGYVGLPLARLFATKYPVVGFDINTNRIHDLKNGKDSTSALYFAGGGKYTLKDSIYTENLEFFNNREWENNKFEFVVKVQNDTLIQKGIEKIEKLGIDRIIVEKYVREK